MFWNNPLPQRPTAALRPAPQSARASESAALVLPGGPPHGGYVDTLLEACRALRAAEWPEAEALLMLAGPLAGEDPAYWNLVGVLWEVRGDSRAAARFYGRAIRAGSHYAPAQQNMRRLFELSRFGHTRQAVALGDEGLHSAAEQDNGAARVGGGGNGTRQVGRSSDPP